MNESKIKLIKQPLELMTEFKNEKVVTDIEYVGRTILSHNLQTKEDIIIVNEGAIIVTCKNKADVYKIEHSSSNKALPTVDYVYNTKFNSIDELIIECFKTLEMGKTINVPVGIKTEGIKQCLYHLERYECYVDCTNLDSSWDKRDIEGYLIQSVGYSNDGKLNLRYITDSGKTSREVLYFEYNDIPAFVVNMEGYYLIITKDYCRLVSKGRARVDKDIKLKLYNYGIIETAGIVDIDELCVMNYSGHYIGTLDKMEEGKELEIYARFNEEINEYEVLGITERKKNFGENL